jgi:hypothetical protein
MYSSSWLTHSHLPTLSRNNIEVGAGIAYSVQRRKNSNLITHLVSRGTNISAAGRKSLVLSVSRSLETSSVSGMVSGFSFVNLLLVAVWEVS